jgi:hypothetical protein
MVMVLTALVFGQVAGFRFVYWDDYFNFVFNTGFTKAWKTAADWGFIFQVADKVRFQPVTWLVYKALHEIFGQDEVSFHVANVAAQVAQAGLFFAVLLRLRPERGSTRAVALAGLVALAWAVNPLRAEPVAWASDLPYMLATLFFLGSMLAYLRGLEAGSGKWMAGAVGLFLLAMSSYPLPLTWPVALPLVALALRPPGGTVSVNAVMRELRKYIVVPAVMLVPAVVVVAVTLYDRAAHPGNYFGPIGMDAAAWLGRLEHVVAAPPYFVFKFLAPFGLSPAHYPECDAVGWALAGFIGIFWAAFLILHYCWRTQLRPLLWFYAYLIACVPVMNLTEPLLIPPDRYAHLANLVMLMGVYDCAAGAGWMERRFRVVMVALGAWVAYSLALCWAQEAVWENSYTLFAYLDAQPCVREHADIYYQVQCDRAGQLLADGNYPEALNQYLDYTQHFVRNAVVLHQIGLTYFKLGQYTEALQFLKEAYALLPNPVTEALMRKTQLMLAEQPGGSAGSPAAKP